MSDLIKELRELAATEEVADRAADELERLQRENEQLRNAIDQEMVIAHLGVFNRGDDPVKAIKELMLWSQGVGEYFAKEELAALKAQSTEPVFWAHPMDIARFPSVTLVKVSDEQIPLITQDQATALVEDFKRRVIDVVNYESESGTSLVSIIESLPLIEGKK